ncbi:hypothetical protein QBC37DRAFT_6306 [Rhypophila decipiens]|uniref:Uncharacterized protein n=1 Tax=Rhypophila decipiens TaxID=261697 RepID=A0AAN6YLR6_9PEZI|nr:hypothetical protein QBC37DRAFT_6306 [Rhypophila decipiens]
MGVKEILDKHILKQEDKVGQDDEKTKDFAAPVDAIEPPHQDDVSSGDDGVVDNGKAVPEALSKRQKVKRHCGRFKWYYVAAVVVLLVILLPILFKVIIPAIMRNVVNNQALPIISGAMVFTSSESMTMALNTSLDTPLGVVIEPVGLALHAPQPEGADNNESPFVTVQMPEQYVDGKTEVEIPTQTATIQDDTQLVAWFNDFFDSETTELRVKADPLVAHLGKLKYSVNMDKTIRVQGLNGLQGFGVSKMNFILPAESNGTNVAGTLMIPNAAVLTLSMGNVSFNLWAGNLNLGIVTAYDLTLKPGNNTPAFQGELYLDQLIPNLGAILDSQNGAISNGFIELNATGNSTSYNGNRITYLEKVLGTKKMLVQFPAATLVTELLSGLLVSGTGSDGSNSTLLDSLGQVLGNVTLLENMLANFEADDTGSEDEAAPSETSTSRVRRGMGAAASKSPSRSVRTNLFRLGLRGLRGRK